MGKKPTYEELEKRLEKLEEETSTRKSLEGQFRTLSESAPFGMSIMKPDMTFEYFNNRNLKRSSAIQSKIFPISRSGWKRPTLMKNIDNRFLPPGRKIQRMHQKRQKKNRGFFQ